ncbi:hypothetical protein [Alkalihalobacillus sp. AL-G]|uniref:YkvI family membrane protein n=1 Tax=Alkalihalobacillus sp. AL-G TaxID=2926399 RepID=UPI00272C7A72|nr:hypothetical protein [Alkalihalobacillus sp. AL-G]WLD91680.1 hypothetical protein MOJ78_11555 [Alkalihalobacillus sp. AL-G]
MKQWSGAFQIAAVYVGTVVGAGFATGKEIVEFFSRFGFIGFITILMSGFLFIFLGTKLMLRAIDLKASSYEELNENLFGRWFAKGMNIVMMLMLLGVCAVMLSGSGAVFAEHLGLPKLAGVLLTVILSFVVMLIGVKGLYAVNSFVVPIMISFNLILMVYSVTDAHFIKSFFTIPYVDDGWKSIVSPFTYAALNLALSQAVLVPVAAEVNDKKIVRLGGILGGALLTLILISSHLTLIMLPNVALYEIPMAVVMKGLVTGIYWIYVIIIYGEIFTSVIGNIYGLEKQISKYINVKSVWIYSGIILIIFSLSKIEYGVLLSLLYPLFGYLSLAFIFLLWFKPFDKQQIK